MQSGRSLAIGALLALSVMASSLAAQEDAPPANAGRGRGGGRGGRGGGGRGGTREFLGLGPAPDEAAAKKGEPLYKQNCATCHGENARGSQGPNLVRSVAVLHDEKGEELGPLIKSGRPQGGMPGFPALSQEDLYNISQYLHLQVELAANRGTYGASYGALRNTVTGDPKKGEEFFNNAGGCNKCHSVSGDLAKIGAKFPQASAMQPRFLWPARQGPVSVNVTLPSGQSIAGTIRVMTDFDISITDAQGGYHQWPRSQVKVEVQDRLEGHRALLAKYTDDDIHNLTAYLVTVK
jgi:cytochrome c oxidase cbb3-type subunit III